MTIPAGTPATQVGFNPVPPPVIPELRVATVQPGDVIVANADRDISLMEAARLRELIRSYFPDNEVLVLSGCELTVQRSGAGDVA